MLLWLAHLFNPLLVEGLSDKQEEDDGGEDESSFLGKKTKRRERNRE